MKKILINLPDFEKKCTSWHGDACATFAAAYAQGKYAKQDMKKEAELWKRSV